MLIWVFFVLFLCVWQVVVKNEIRHIIVLARNKNQRHEKHLRVAFVFMCARTLPKRPKHAVLCCETK